MYYCEKCGKVVTNYYGSGRFCSRSCANSRDHSEETKRKIAEQTKLAINEKWPKRKRYYCELCGKEIRHKTLSGCCRQCYSKSEYGKKQIKETAKTIQYVGWVPRNIVSYPERFWENVLLNNHIKFEHNYPVKQSNGKNNYFLDFYINKNGVKIDLEIDGKQHTYSDRKIHDEKRDKYLTEIGYIIYRIPWNEINSESGKDQMKTKIDSFITFYNEI